MVGAENGCAPSPRPLIMCHRPYGRVSSWGVQLQSTTAPPMHAPDGLSSAAYPRSNQRAAAAAAPPFR